MIALKNNVSMNSRSPVKKNKENTEMVIDQGESYKMLFAGVNFRQLYLSPLTATRIKIKLSQTHTVSTFNVASIIYWYKSRPSKYTGQADEF